MRLCRDSAEAAQNAWDARATARAKGRDEQLVRELRASKPLDWDRLAGAFARAYYGDAPELTTSGETLHRPTVSLAQGNDALSDGERAQVAAAFGPISKEAVLRTIASTKPALKIALVCDRAPGSATQREQVFRSADGKVSAVDAPRIRRGREVTRLLGSHQCDALYDLADVDGDGTPELVLRRYEAKGNVLRAWTEIWTLAPPPKLRFKGGGSSVDTTRW